MQGVSTCRECQHAGSVNMQGVSTCRECPHNDLHFVVVRAKFTYLKIGE